MGYGKIAEEIQVVKKSQVEERVFTSRNLGITFIYCRYHVSNGGCPLLARLGEMDGT
ncbi:MAG: hypothetical protein ACE5KV_06215 [Thermoplasmata archaeon]